MRGQILTLIIEEGMGNVCGDSFSRTLVMIVFQMGDAPVIPEAIWLMGVLSLLPTQTPTR